MKKLDIVIILSLCAVCLAVFAVRFIKDGGNDPARVDVYVAGVLYKTVYRTDGAQRIDIRTPHGYNVLTVYPDGAKMTEADCPAQTCVRTPKQKASGSVITCLPHSVLVKLDGDFR